MSNIVSVSAFVDWNSQLRVLSPKNKAADPTTAARLVLSQTAGLIARSLQKTDASARFKVQLRLYHGWHKGFEPTKNKRAITQVLAYTDSSDLSPVKNVVFNEQVGYGDRLVYALPERLHTRLGIHLPNTLREKNGLEGEKMVDTALASDVVCVAANEPRDWIIVVAEDDDLIPPIFTAEAFLKRYAARVLLLQHRESRSTFMDLSNITVKL